MISNPDTAFILLIGLTAVLFGGLIFVGLKWRTDRSRAWIALIDAKWVLDSCPTPKNDVKSLLYGLFQDHSNTSVGIDVKDLNNNLVGRVLYNMGDVTIEVGTDKYRIFNKGALNLQATLRLLTGAGELSPPIAECQKVSLFRFRFKDCAAPVVDLDVRQKLGVATVVVDGRVIGKRWELGKAVVRGRALALTADLPLVMQMFVLAAPGSRRGQQL